MTHSETKSITFEALPYSKIHVPVGGQVVMQNKRFNEVLFTDDLKSCIGIAGINQTLERAFVCHYPTHVDLEKSFEDLLEGLNDDETKNKKFKVALAGGERWGRDCEILHGRISKVLDSPNRLDLEFEIVDDHTFLHTEEEVLKYGVSLGINLATGVFIHD